MVRRTASLIAFTAALTASPALAEETLLMAEASSSKSRAEARHDTSGDTVVKTTSARSKARRTTRGDTASEETVVATTNRGKRSRRNPGKNDLAAPMVASNEVAPTGLMALATNTNLLAARVKHADFSGEAGALVLYQLVGKSLAEMPLSDVEKRALKTAMEGTNVSWLIADTEARLTQAADHGENLDDIAEALGVPRPVATPGMSPNLGASLAVETEISPG